MGDRRNLGHTSADRVSIWSRLRKHLIDDLRHLAATAYRAENARLKANLHPAEPVDELTTTAAARISGTARRSGSSRSLLDANIPAQYRSGAETASSPTHP